MWVNCPVCELSFCLCCGKQNQWLHSESRMWVPFLGKRSGCDVFFTCAIPPATPSSGFLFSFKTKALSIQVWSRSCQALSLEARIVKMSGSTGRVRSYNSLLHVLCFILPPFKHGKHLFLACWLEWVTPHLGKGMSSVWWKEQFACFCCHEPWILFCFLCFAVFAVRLLLVPLVLSLNSPIIWRLDLNPVHEDLGGLPLCFWICNSSCSYKAIQ